MADEVAVGHVDHHVLPRATGRPPVQHHVMHIGDEVRLHEPVLDLGRLPAEVELVGGVEPIGERHGAVEDEFGAAVEVEGGRGVGRAVQPHRLFAAGVVQLVPGVERNGEDAPLLPFEGVLRLALVPDGGRTAPLQHEEYLLVHVTLDVERTPGRNLADEADCPLVVYERTIERVGGEVEQRGFRAGALPRLDVDGVDVIDELLRVHVQSFVGHPLLVRGQCPRLVAIGERDHAAPPLLSPRLAGVYARTSGFARCKREGATLSPSDVTTTDP